jgi:phage gp45-like
MTWTAEDFANAIGEFRRTMRGLVRRVKVDLTDAGGFWRVLGHTLFDPTDREGRDVANYPGIGIAARPPVDAGAEAIVVNVGGQNNPAIVATRDEATRAKVDDVATDETAIYNSSARVHVKVDGSIEARTHAGTASQLVTMDDFNALIGILNGAGTGAATAIPAAIAAYQGAHPTWPDGTKKFGAE